MYIITCMKDGEEYKLVKEENIGCDWGKDIFNAKTFETQDDAVNFIINESKFIRLNNNRLPYLLDDIDIDSVYIKKVEEIKYKKVLKVNFDRLINQLL